MGRIITNEHFGIPRELSRGELLRRLKSGDVNSCLMFSYLGLDEDLDEVIASDKKVLAELGVTYDTVAKSIEELFLSDSDNYNGNPVIRREFIHSPVCPWDDYCSVSPFNLSSKVTEIVLVNGEKLEEAITFMEERGDDGLRCFPELVRRDLGMIFSDIHPHLIRDHYFFEGHQTPYRVDPRRTVRYLNLGTE